MNEQAQIGVEIGIWAALRELYGSLSTDRRREFLVLLAFMLAGAIAELATIGSVIPFLALLSAQSGAVHLPWLAAAFASLGLKLGFSPIIAAAVIFAIFAVAGGLIRLELTWLTQDFAFHCGHELAIQAQLRVLSQPYTFYIARNSSTLITATDKVEILVFDLVLPIIQTLIAIFIAAFLIAGLLFISPLATLIATGAFVVVYGIVSAAAARRLIANSSVIGASYHQRLKVEQESLGGIRDVIIDNSQALHVDLFSRVNARLARARASTNFMSHAPRFVVESVGIVVVVIIALLLAQRPGGIALALPFLGALAVGAQRLLPLAQNVYNGWSLAAAHKSIIGQVVELMRLPVPEDADDTAAPLELNHRIRFDDVSFSYPTARRTAAIQNVSIDIERGSMIVFTGPTGGGKTTLADLLMGLIEPSEGRIWIDGIPLDRRNARRWHKSVAHVPQSLFLADTTIAANIALSLPNAPLDLDRIIDAAKKAQLHEFVMSLPEGYETYIGERGVRLSGGQRQRLGIARAIYKQAPVLVLDEPTSALDEATEAEVVASLAQLRGEGRTIVIIAHRQSMLRHSDTVARLDRGRLVDVSRTAATHSEALDSPEFSSPTASSTDPPHGALS